MRGFPPGDFPFFGLPDVSHLTPGRIPHLQHPMNFGPLNFKGSPPSPSSFFLGLPNGPIPGLGVPPQHGDGRGDPSTPPFPPGFHMPMQMALATSGSGSTPNVNSGGRDDRNPLGSPGAHSIHNKSGAGKKDSPRGGPMAWPGLPLGSAPIFGRHRAQHSAPRGGPPRAWSNADLTEALHNVWNKKMTTSQVSLKLVPFF